MEKKGLKQTIMQTSHIIMNRAGKKHGWSLHLTGASCVGNTLLGLGKLVMGVLSMSFFTCASALYTFGMVAAKLVALVGFVKMEDSREQHRYYKCAGCILIVSSVLYMIYSIRLFIHPKETVYHMYIALAIATFTFTEIGLNIRGVIVERKNHAPLIHAIKMINLSSSLICLVLTQTAILSFASDLPTHAKANGLMGIIMGGVATLIGVYMILRITAIEHNWSLKKYFKREKGRKEDGKYSGSGR